MNGEQCEEGGCVGWWVRACGFQCVCVFVYFIKVNKIWTCSTFAQLGAAKCNQSVLEQLKRSNSLSRLVAEGGVSYPPRLPSLFTRISWTVWNNNVEVREKWVRWQPEGEKTDMTKKQQILSFLQPSQLLHRGGCFSMSFQRLGKTIQFDHVDIKTRGASHYFEYQNYL